MKKIFNRPGLHLAMVMHATSSNLLHASLGILELITHRSLYKYKEGE
jgi:hypothetical protein